MRSATLAAVFSGLSCGAALAEMSVDLGAPWDGVEVPEGQQCSLFGGNGATPPMQVSGLPDGTVMIISEFNDESYQPLSRNGGHGAIGFAVSGTSAQLPSVPGLSDDLPDGVRVIRAARSSGRYASLGYLPPCSGGRGNLYSVDLLAIDAGGVVLETLSRVPIGRY